MTGKELIFKTIKLEETDRVPWVPFVGCHGANLLGVTATEYLQSADLLVKGVKKAVELYQADGIPVAFDLQIEAEALGCELAWADENPPAVVSHPLQNEKKLEEFHIPGPNEGRIPILIEAAQQMRQNHPDIALYGLITGPFTLALHLLGTDIFMKLFEEPEEIQKLMDFAKRVGMAMTDYLVEAGCDIIAVVDPMTSQIDPASFEMFVSPPATELFEYIRQKGAYGSFFVCGNAQQNIEVMCQCKPDNVSIDENIPLDFVRNIALKHQISFGGNMKLTVVLLMGSQEDSQREALECMDLGGKKGFILAPGCDLPMATPPENLQAVTQLVHDPYQQDVIRTMERTPEALDLLNMKDYGHTDKVIVDIITLDSESCAPCQYMVEAVKKVAPHFEDIVEWREHPIKKMEAVTFMASLMVKNIPTICIDGKIAFVSQIPPKNELIAAIQKRINEKLRLKIRAKRAELLLMGTTDECKQLQQNVDLAIKELGKDITIKCLHTKEDIQAYGVFQTPALVLTRYTVKSQGETPSAELIKEWLKTI